jgi:uncharacterized delta-60 repeat protein
MAIQDDGKIVLAGNTGYADGQNMMFVRTSPDGNIDSSFGMNGYAIVNSSTSSEGVRGVGILSSGNIIGAGYTYWGDPEWSDLASIVLIHEDGSPVTEFGDNGVLIPTWSDSYSYAYGVEIHNDDIYVTGFIQKTDNDIFLGKLDGNGVFDPLFADNGLALFDFNIIDQAFDVYWGPDQKIYICGNTGAPGAGASKEFLLVRYMPDGTLDTSLNGSGHVETEIRVDSDAPFAVKLQADGKIVLAGMSSGLSTTEGNNVAAVRYLNNYTPLVAGFSASDTVICQEEYVMFTDLSTSNAVSWNWYFEGGEPENSTEQNPVVYYETPGVYDVQLIISDGTNEDTLLAEDFITVNDCTGIEENSQQQIRIFPNPAKGVVNYVFFTGEGNSANLTIFNTQGHIVKQEMVKQVQSEMNISSLNQGIYFVRIQNAEINKTLKLIIE